MSDSLKLKFPTEEKLNFDKIIVTIDINSTESLIYFGEQDKNL